MLWPNPYLSTQSILHITCRAAARLLFAIVALALALDVVECVSLFVF